MVSIPSIDGFQLWHNAGSCASSISHCYPGLNQTVFALVDSPYAAVSEELTPHVHAEAGDGGPGVPGGPPDGQRQRPRASRAASGWSGRTGTWSPCGPCCGWRMICNCSVATKSSMLPSTSTDSGACWSLGERGRTAPRRLVPRESQQLVQQRASQLPCRQPRQERARQPQRQPRLSRRAPAVGFRPNRPRPCPLPDLHRIAAEGTSGLCQEDDTVRILCTRPRPPPRATGPKPRRRAGPGSLGANVPARLSLFRRKGTWPRRTATCGRSSLPGTTCWRLTASARRGKRCKPDAARFDFAWETNLLDLPRQLRDGTYVPGMHRHFYIYDPKKRKISHSSDRVVHHAVVNVLEPHSKARPLRQLRLPAG